MRLIEFARRWRQRHASLRELGALGREARRELAEDLAMKETNFYDLVSYKDANRGLLSRLLGVIGLNVDHLSRSQPAVMRDMAIVCSRCPMTRRCRRELDQQQAELSYRQYCANAGTIIALCQDRSR